MENKNKLHIVFMPISVYLGMAGTKRLNNYLKYLQNKYVQCSNIVITHDKNIKVDKRSDYLIYNKFLGELLIPIRAVYLLFRKKRKYCSNILYQYGYPDLINVWYIVIAKLMGYKIIFDIVEDNSTRQIFPNIFVELKTKTSLLLIKKINLLADGLIVISTHLLEKFTKITNGKLPTILIPITIEVDSFNFKKQKAVNNTLNIFYGGSFDAKDGINYLLNAFNKISKKYTYCNLVITGSGARKNMDSFFRKLESLECKENIKYLGYLNRDEYENVLNSADIHCMVRTNSEFANAGFPFKLGEMLATGAPVIATSVGDVPHFLTDNKDAVIIEPEKSNAITIAIEDLILNKEKRNTIGFNGKKIAVQEFNSEIHSQNLLYFLEDLCNKGTGLQKQKLNPDSSF